jgi:hypothetical protein
MKVLKPGGVVSSGTSTFHVAHLICEYLVWCLRMVHDRQLGPFHTRTQGPGT